MAIKNNLRALLVQETARIMVQDAVLDYQIAKKRACARLGLKHYKDWPGNQEIEQAVLAYQHLFNQQQQQPLLQQQYRDALAAMRLFAPFQPHLVGSLLRDVAQPHSDVVLHLFSDDAKNIGLFLLDKHIPHQTVEHCFHSMQKSYPAYRFLAGEQRILLVVFPVADLRWSPPDPVTQKPMQRANGQKVQHLHKMLSMKIL